MTVPAGSETSSATPGAAPAAADLDRLRIDRSAPSMRRRRRFTPWIVLALVVAGIAAAVWVSMGEELLAPKVKAARVVRVPPTEGLVRTTASGYVVARRRAAISSRLSGRLEMLTVDVDDPVEEGQLLGRLGCADLDAAVDEARALVAVRAAEVETTRREAKALAAAAAAAVARAAEPEAMLREMDSRVADAERTVRREQELKPGVATSQEALDRAMMERDVAKQKRDQVSAQLATLLAQAEQTRIEAQAAEARIATAIASVAAAEAAQKRAAANRMDADIVAPFAGRVLRKEAEIGEMVAPVNSAGSTTRGAIVTLADFSTLEMEVDVIERDISLIEAGGPCRIVLDSRARDVHPYAGVVRQVVPAADRTKSTVQVKVSFRSLDKDVRPDGSGRVEFLNPGVDDSIVLGHDRVFVPQSAVVERNGKRGAFEIKDGRAAFHEIAAPTSPAAKEGFVEVASGLVGGEDVVLAPAERLADGQLVRLEETKK